MIKDKVPIAPIENWASVLSPIKESGYASQFQPEEREKEYIVLKAPNGRHSKLITTKTSMTSFIEKYVIVMLIVIDDFRDLSLHDLHLLNIVAVKRFKTPSSLFHIFNRLSNFLFLAFQPQSPGQANGHPVNPQQYVAANPITQAQTVAQTHTVTRIAQSPMKPQVNGTF